MTNSEIKPASTSIRILIANEPFAYRDVLGSSLRILRPEFTIHVTGSGSMQDDIDCFDPHLIIHSRETFDDETPDRAWILLNQGGRESGRCSTSHGSEAIEKIDFNVLLRLIDCVVLSIPALQSDL